MSLILDALKKSEQERRRERGPDLQSIHRPVMGSATPTRRNGWLLVGAVVVLINGAAVAWWVLRDDNEAVVASVSTPMPTAVETAQPVAPNAATPVAPITQPPVSQPPIAPAPIGTPVAPSAAAPSTTAATQSPASLAAVTTITGEPEFTPVAPGGGAQSSAPIQELWELPEAVRRSLPPMTYSFHVYSSDPARRTIIINNRRLREGEQVADDLLLDEITPDGVVLATAGYRVHIAVLGEW